MWGKNGTDVGVNMEQNYVPYLSITYGLISKNFDKRVFRVPDVQAYAKL